MKKFLMFAMIAMIAVGASAQVVSWIGNSAIYVVEEDAWYNASANWASSPFNGHDFGTVYSLTLGGNAETWTDDNSSHPGWTVLMNYQVDALGVQDVSLPWLSYTPNNDKWENMTGEDIIATTGTGGSGDHSVAVWFSANDGANTVYDSNSSANYVASYDTPIPEPATMSLLGLGALAMVLRRKIRK